MKKKTAPRKRPASKPPAHGRPPAEDAIEHDGLTIKQRLFVAAITGPALSNASKAAKMAGYKGNAATLGAVGYENLNRPQVQAAIRHALAAKCQTPEWAAAELTTLAAADFSQFITIRPSGEPVIDWKKAAAHGALGAIRELSYDKDTGKPRVKMHDRAMILRTLLQLYGKVIEKHEHTGPGGAPLSLVVDTGLVQTASAKSPLTTQPAD